MFNTYIQKPRETRFITKEIIEKRAPTDESVRLLKEFEEKAQQKVINQIKVTNNVMSGTILVTRLQTYDMTYKCYFKFKLNGIDYESEKEIYDNDTITNTHELTKIMYKLVSNTISSLLYGKIH